MRGNGFAALWSAEDTGQSFCHGLLVAFLNQFSDEEFRDSAHLGGNDREATAHCFKGDIGHAFVVTRNAEDISSPYVLCNFRR